MVLIIDIIVGIQEGKVLGVRFTEYLISKIGLG